MDVRPLSPDFSVLNRAMTAQDVADLADAGYKTIVNNRPDAEIVGEDDSATVAAACAAAGIDYHYIPLGREPITPQMLDAFSQALAAPGPALGYCRTGRRSTMLWSLVQAGKMPVDDIISAAQAAGYDLETIRPMLENAAGSSG